MNAEHLLDAMGLLDDDLIREAEEYRRPKARHNYGVWLGWAASFAVVLVLSYGLSHLRLGSGNSAAPMAPAGSSGGSTPAASAPSGEPGDGELKDPAEDRDPVYGGDASEPASPEPPEPDIPGNGCGFDAAVEIFGMESGQIPAIMVDGTLYWFSSAFTVMRPEESDIRYSTSRTQGEPREDGQINFPRENVRYVLLEDGTVALNWDGSYEWSIFSPDPPSGP